jgi:hypothetical protein
LLVAGCWSLAGSSSRRRQHLFPTPSG